MTGSLHAIAADSLASGNGLIGFASASQIGKAVATFTLTNSKAANNKTGVISSVSAVGSANAVMFLNGSTMSGNSSDGFQIFGSGVINSYGNNAITDTTNNGTLTHVALQ
jgi:hypothetical protein